jgi:ATP-binding cassette, subfamily F, member 3
VLDEPTNHLDLWACDALEQALLDFDGSAIVVSHDRYFLNRVVDILLVLEGDGVVRVIYGNYDTYLRMQALQEGTARTDKTPKKEVPKAAETLPDEAGKHKTKRKRRYPYRKVAELEADIADAENYLRDLERQLASAELYRDGDKVKDTMKAFEDTKITLRQLYEHWEEAEELN